MKKLSILLLSLLFVACGQGGDTSKTGEAETGPIKIGGLAPLSGDAALYGEFLKNTVVIAVDEINQAGGIKGRQLEIIWEDGKCNPNDASKAAQKLVNIDKVKYILGGGCSGETLAAAPITEKAKVILFSSLSTSPEVTKAGDFVFRTAPSDSSQGKVVAKAVTEAGYTKVGLLNEQTDYAVGVADTFKKHFEGEVVHETYLTSESDFKTRITKLKAAGIETLVIIPQSPNKGRIAFKQLQEQEVNVPLYLSEVMSDPSELAEYADYLTSVGANVSNFYVAETEQTQALVEKYKEVHGKDPIFLPYVYITYDAVNILAKVLNEVEDLNDTEAIRDALYAVEDYQGMYPGITLDENGDSSILFAMFTYDGKQLNLAE